MSASGLLATEPNPARILEIGFGFWGSKTLLSAVELGLFTELGSGEATAESLRARLGLHSRSACDFFDTLVALGLLQRAGEGDTALYANTAETALFLDKQSAVYVGGLLEMLNARLYGFWGNLTTALRSGLPQAEQHSGTEDKFEALYAETARLEQFIQAMRGTQIGAFTSILDAVDLPEEGVICDIGGADGFFSVLALRKHPRLRAISFDLPAVQPIAERLFAESGLSDRAESVAGDALVDPLPYADVAILGNLLHAFSTQKKQLLMRRVYDILPSGGRLIAVEHVIDDARRVHAMGLMMSLNMLIETTNGANFTGADFDAWACGAGFTRTEIVPLVSGISAAIAYKL